MAKCYFELRKQSARGTDSVAADVMRHLHARQHLGKSVIICDQPVPMLAACRKQWLKLMRAIQKQRASTLNADKILKYTHTITHMQYMRFTAKTALEDPDADVYFLTKEQCAALPIHCYSVYCTVTLSRAAATTLLEQLPAETLLVDYYHTVDWAALGLQDKAILEKQVDKEWLQVQQFLSVNNIQTKSLVHSGAQNVGAMDDALDTLLGISRHFLSIANDFRRTMELARPLKINRSVRQEYDAFMIIAYRVQALTPGIFTQDFLESYNEDDTFFLYDVAQDVFVSSGEPLTVAVARHTAAGRPHLAKALQHLFNGRGSKPRLNRPVFES